MLDRTKDFGRIYGDHPAVYEQDGKLFNGAGYEVDAEGVVIEKVEEVASEETSYADMSAKDLKVLVEERGGSYKNKDTAIEFLEADDADSDDDEE